MAVGNNNDLEKRLWNAADGLRANSGLKSSEYSTPVLGLIFLRYADQKFTEARKELEGKGSGRRTIGAKDYHAKGVLYLPESARFQTLLKLPEGVNIGKNINEAMKDIEEENTDFKDKVYVMAQKGEIPVIKIASNSGFDITHLGWVFRQKEIYV